MGSKGTNIQKLLLIPRAGQHFCSFDESPALGIWIVESIFIVTIENKQCVHLRKQSTCKVADEYDRWFNLSLGLVKCAWLAHEWLVKMSLLYAMGSQLCKWGLFDAWVHSQREYADCHLDGPTQPTKTPRTIHPYYDGAFAVGSRTQNKERMMWGQLNKKSLMAQNEQKSSPFSKDDNKNRTHFTVQACALMGFDRCTWTLFTHCQFVSVEPLFHEGKREHSK